MDLQDLTVGENYVYHSGPKGWRDVPKDIKEIVTAWIEAGRVTHFTRRNADGGFDMVIQKLKSRK